MKKVKVNTFKRVTKALLKRFEGCHDPECSMRVDKPTHECCCKAETELLVRQLNKEVKTQGIRP